MKKGNSTLIVLLVVIVLFVLGFVIFGGSQNEERIIEHEQGDAMEQKEEEVMEQNSAGDTMVEGEVMELDSGDAMMEKSSGSYEEYSSEKLARAENGDVVLFFHASWCPTCRAADADINASLSSIPEGVTILKTDYDSNGSLRQKYGVTMQHTFVQVDQNGELIKKWSGSPSLSAIVNEII